MRAPRCHSWTDRREMPLLGHLEELRRLLFQCLGALAIAVAITLPLAPWILKRLLAPLERAVPAAATATLWSIEVAGAFTAAMRLGLWSGLLLSAPVLLLLSGRFVLPGLTLPERRLARRAGAASCLLFGLGAVIAHTIVLPTALRWLYNMHAWLGVSPHWTVSSYVAFTVRLLLAFGLAFQLPVVVLALSHLGLLTRAQLAAKRRHVLVGLLVVTALLTPPDVITQLMLAAPLALLYEACIALLALRERRSGQRDPNLGARIP